MDHELRHGRPKAGEEIKAQYPLAAAEVTVAEVPGNPGYYIASFTCAPTSSSRA